MVAGLTNDVAYTFQLRAVNAGGVSTAAEAGPATPRSGVCGRTEQVRDAIVAAIVGVSDCADVTTTQLGRVTTLVLELDGIKSLQPDDFSGLTALELFLILQRAQFASRRRVLRPDCAGAASFWAATSSARFPPASSPA